MAQITLEGDIPSITVDKEFLEKLFKIVNAQNPKGISVKTRISINGERETRSYENLEDFNSARYWPRNISTISISKEASRKRDTQKVVAFHLEIHTDHPGDSFYQLAGYNEGKIEVCKKEIESLIDEHKTWYNIIFKGSKPDEEDSKGGYGILAIAAAVSLSLLLYRALILFLKPENSDTIQGIAFFSFFFFAWWVAKIGKRFFPFLDLRIRKTRRSKFWNFVIGAIVLALIGNLIWEGIRLLI